MDDLGDDDDLFDADLEDVPANTLQQIEQKAISSQRLGYARKRDATGPAEGLRPTHGADPESHTLGEDSITLPPSSDYGFDDEDVIDLDDPAATFGQHDAPFAVGANPFGQQAARIQSHHARDRSGGDHDIRVQQPSADLEAMQKRLAELEQDRIRLSKELDEAKIDVTTKAGAIANLRSRNDRTTKDFEAQIAALRKQQADERAKLKAEIQSAKSDQERVKTSNKFLEHDLADEMERAKRLRGTANGSASITNPVPRATTVTPKKANKHGFADGFDDHEITAISPTKRPEKGRGGTPKAGNKRKRIATASPSTIPNGSPMAIDSPTKPGPAEDDLELEAIALSRLVLKDERIQTMQGLLTLQDKTGRRIVDALGELSFPGDESSIASHLLQGLSTLPVNDAVPASVGIRSICLDLWERCRSINHWKPLGLILDVYMAMLDQESSRTHVMLFERLVVLVSRTCADVAEPRIKQMPQVIPGLPPSDAALAFPDVDDLQILSILQVVASAASLRIERCGAFWQRMDFNFVVLMLNRLQPISHIQIMVQMITASVLEDSFGVRPINAEEQVKQEAHLLDRLSNLLSDKLVSLDSNSRSTATEAAGLRVRIFHAIRAISSTQHGSTALAEHRTFIGRLVRFICDQVSSLSTIPPLPEPETRLIDGQQPTVHFSQDSTLHDKVIASINMAVRILYHLLHDHEIRLSEKLEAVKGGNYKYLIGLSRIAFSERLLGEAGLEDEVVEAANQILDNSLQPAEGEAIVAVMETPGSTHSTRPSASAVSAPK
ncbi:hypothetical protein CAC42_4885 [Sphaceloma murrayae]|uniref:DNA repair protein rad26 n=1 Tax=Sphaceloma murrayae TaxID=2082308 RepID=A0A2K1QPH9_9PEZI|nr:hypothetical protein CAC42_4885 [Sphaceloma murrayae]